MAGTSAPSSPASTSPAPAAAAAAACSTVVTGASKTIPGSLRHGCDITDRAWHDSYVPVVFLIAIAVVLVGIFFAATGRGGELAYEHADHAPLDLGPVSAADIALLRPPTAMWGYNMQVTDAALDQIARAMRERDVTIAYLQEQLAGYEHIGSYPDYSSTPNREAPTPARPARLSILLASSRPQAPPPSPTPWSSPPAPAPRSTRTPSTPWSPGTSRARHRRGDRAGAARR